MRRERVILLVGPAPENIGGISIHIRRLTATLADTYRFDYIDEGRKRWPNRFNIRSLNIFTYIRKMVNADVVHIHSGAPSLRMFAVLTAKWLLRKPVVVTVHRDPNIEPMLKLTKRLLRKCDKIICVNQKGIDALSDTNAQHKYQLLPAFLPPVIEQEPELPEQITRRINDIRQAGGKLMISNAWRLVMKDGVDLYGLDLCVEALGILTQKDKNMHLIFVVPDTTGSDEYIASIQQRADRLGVADRLTVYTSSLSFVRLMAHADMVLRPTITDGDAITIREALYYGVPVVASDVVDRPQGVTLHANRDANSLADAIIRCESQPKPDNTNKLDYKQIYRQIYSEQMK